MRQAIPPRRGLFPLIGALLLVLSLSGCSSFFGPDRLYSTSPTLLPGTTAEMNSPGYWIGRHPDPDRVIMDQEGIAEFNQRILDRKLVRDLLTISEVSGDSLRAELSSAANWIGRLAVYQDSGRRVDSALLSPLEALENRDAIPATLRGTYAFLLRRADLRVLPTTSPLYDAPGDRFIDNLQASSLEPGTPAVLLHWSSDGAWVYAATALASGWLPSDAVVPVSLEAFLARRFRTDLLVVVAGRADLYEDPGLTRWAGYLRMGTSLSPSPEGQRGNAVAALLPGRDAEGAYAERTVWIESAQVNQGYLPYTARTIYRQAFALLNAPYGWGGMFGERDCSQFLCEIFATVGLALPRNSSAQARAGSGLIGFSSSTAEEEKRRLLLETAAPGATLLRLPGHIMLYLGASEGRPYVIHSTWAYRERRGFSDVQRLINRVVVSTLDLGSGSSVGNHLSRLTAATELLLQP